MAVKFQHFKAEKIVSDFSFRNLGGQFSHQAKWGKPGFEVYRQYECNRDWNEMLAETARAAGVDFMTTPYDMEAVEQLDSYLPAYKIGSGDITWRAFIGLVAAPGTEAFFAKHGFAARPADAPAMQLAAQVFTTSSGVVDKATVPIYYESRLAKLELKESERPRIDPEFEEATEGEEVERKEKLKTKWAQLEAVVGSENRIRLIARDRVEHFEHRLAAMDGKAMIVCMSRRIGVELYREIVALRPAWHHDADEQGTLKIVMTGSASDPMDWQPHIRSKARREELEKRFKHVADPDNPADPLEPLDIVIGAVHRGTVGRRRVDPAQGQALGDAVIDSSRIPDAAFPSSS